MRIEWAVGIFLGIGLVTMGIFGLSGIRSARAFGMPSALSARVDLSVAVSTSVSQETMKRAWYSETMQIGGDNFATFSFPTEGYDRISLYLSTYDNATVNVYFIVGQSEVKMDTIILNPANPTAERVYQVIGDELAVTSGALVTVNVYATA